jgi:GNAT superfamily N-acetyltransferase
VGFLAANKHVYKNFSEYYCLDTIQIEKAYRRQGLGSSLMLESMRKAKSEGFKYFSVSYERKYDISDYCELSEWEELSAEEREAFEEDQLRKEPTIKFFESLSHQYGITTEKRIYTVGRSEMEEMNYELSSMTEV